MIKRGERKRRRKKREERGCWLMRGIRSPFKAVRPIGDLVRVVGNVPARPDGVLAGKYKST